jgi:hypothetical protein
LINGCAGNKITTPKPALNSIPVVRVFFTPNRPGILCRQIIKIEKSENNKQCFFQQALFENLKIWKFEDHFKS